MAKRAKKINTGCDTLMGRMDDRVKPNTNSRPVALITGSGKHRIGRVVADALAARGYSVVIHYHRSSNEAKEAAAALRARGADAVALPADFAQEPQIERLVQDVLERYERIDVLVNAAAIWIAKPLEQVTGADVRQHFEVNTLGTFLCAQRVGLAMVRQPEGGSIVTIGDWAIERPYLNYAAYFVSKGAIPTLTRTLAVELGRRNSRVRVNCILPGPVLLREDMPPTERRAVIDATLVKREGRPNDVARTVLFLIENDFVTGACVPVDGGRTIYAPDEA